MGVRKQIEMMKLIFLLFITLVSWIDCKKGGPTYKYPGKLPIIERARKPQPVARKPIQQRVVAEPAVVAVEEKPVIEEVVQVIEVVEKLPSEEVVQIQQPVEPVMAAPAEIVVPTVTEDIKPPQYVQTVYKYVTVEDPTNVVTVYATETITV